MRQKRLKPGLQRNVALPSYAEANRLAFQASRLESHAKV